MGPLDGLVVVELDAIGPVPFCGMLLADLGADVIRIDRVGGSDDLLRTINLRNRRSVAVDIRQPGGVDVVIRLTDTADVLLEGMRPGVAERLGLGPDILCASNPGLVYGRMTGWGQSGPYATMAGHDIDYIALTGALHAIGGDEPVPPLNLVGDFGGGAMYLAFGVMAALHERATSGRGQVVDAAMVDGASSLMSMVYELRSLGLWNDERQTNLLDGAAPFYRTYRTADGGFIAVGALEPQFFVALLDGLGLPPEVAERQMDRTAWPAMATLFAETIAQRTRQEWEVVFAGTDACVAPVLSLEEAPHHPHIAERGTFIEGERRWVPGPAPRFSRSSLGPVAAPPPAGADTDTVLADLGMSASDIGALRARGIVG